MNQDIDELNKRSLREMSRINEELHTSEEEDAERLVDEYNRKMEEHRKIFKEMLQKLLK